MLQARLTSVPKEVAPAPRRTFCNTLLGFEDANAEAEYQVQLATAAWKVDIVADVTFFVITTSLCCYVASVAPGIALQHFLVANGLILIRACLNLFQKTPRKARWRARLMFALRLQVMYLAVEYDSVFEAPNFGFPNPSLSLILRNVLYASRIANVVTFSLGQQLTFTYHLPQQLLSVPWYMWVNARLCRSCSRQMQEAFAGAAQSFHRMVAAGVLLPPPERPVLPLEQACSAVVTTLHLLLAVLLPCAWLLYSETKSRMEFLDRWEGRRRLAAGKPSQAAARAWLEREASLAVLPLLTCLLLLPLIGLLWNLVVHAHHLY